MRALVVIFIASFCGLNLKPQSIDSLKQASQKEKTDSIKVKLLSQLTEMCELDEIVDYAEPLAQLAEQNYKQEPPNSYLYRFYISYYAEALGNLGYYYKYKGEISKALDFYTKSISFTVLAGDTAGQALTLNNIGMIFSNIGDIEKALSYFNKSLSVYESIHNKEGVALCYNNIAGVYENQGELTEAFTYYNRCLEIRKNNNDKAGMAIILNNLGYLQLRKGDTATALNYCEANLKTNESLDNKRGVANSLNNIGFIYFNQGKIEEALKLYYKSLELRTEIDDKQGKAFSLNNISLAYLKQHRSKEALDAASNALILSKELGFPEMIKDVALTLKKIYLSLNNQKEALEMFELHIQMRDSIQNEQTRRSAIKSALSYEFRKKEAVLEEKQDKERLLAAANDQRQKVIILFVVICCLIILVFSIVIYNRLKITRTQKNIIEEQKLLVETHRTEIIDSINYARRIQFALLASDSLLKKHLPEYFVLFKPKSVVSGDFYWGTPVKDGFIFITADCTGHGVPGAFMSLLNISKLNQTITENKIIRPDLILNEVRNEIIKALNPEGSIEQSKDGMDAIVCKLDLKHKKLTYAAANNSFYLVRSDTLIHCPADKMPVGMGHNDLQPFTLHDINLETGDVIYTFSDGYADQFGGPKGKKFKYKALEELILSISSKSLVEQKEILHNTFEKWKLNLEQVDDVCIIGIRV